MALMLLLALLYTLFFFFSSRRRHTRFDCDWSSDVCSSDLHTDQRKSSAVNSVKLRRQTIQVCAPGVSMSRCLIFLEASQPRNLRLMSIKQIGRASCRERV